MNDASPSAWKDSNPVESLLNLGPLYKDLLHGVGIHTVGDLRQQGAVSAFQTVLQAGLPARIHLLFSLEGALTHMRIGRISPQRRNALLREAFGAKLHSNDVLQARAM